MNLYQFFHKNNNIELLEFLYHYYKFYKSKDKNYYLSMKQFIDLFPIDHIPSIKFKNNMYLNKYVGHY